MGVQLLDKTRKINKLLHNNSSSKVVFNDICEVLTEILNSNVLVISKKGKVLGGSKCEGVPYITELIEREIGKHVDDMLNERLLSILSTKENVNLQTLGFSEEAVKGYQAIITPIDIAGERLGTLFIYKKDKVYEIDDIILSEYGTTVVGLEMLRSVNEESAEETRKINKLLHNNSSSKVVFNDICEVLTEILDSNVLVISKKGKVLGGSKCEGVPYITELIEREIGKHVDDMLNERLLSILSTKENVNLQTLGFSEETVKGYQAIITPIDIAGERLGTLFIYKKDKVYEIDDIILSEYGTTVVGLEMLRSVNEESAEETRKEHIVQSAISTLSYSELEAIIHIFDELDGAEGILVASKIADRVGITRSVIVNALRKFESAGVIESRSSGMKGTYIKVINDYVFTELDRIKAERTK